MNITCAKCKENQEIEIWEYNPDADVKTFNRYIYCRCVYSSYKITLNELNQISHYRIMINNQWIAASEISNRTFIGNGDPDRLKVYESYFALENNDIPLEIQAKKIFDKLKKLENFS